MFSIVTRSGAIWLSKEMEKGSKGRTKFTSHTSVGQRLWTYVLIRKRNFHFRFLALSPPKPFKKPGIFHLMNETSFQPVRLGVDTWFGMDLRGWHGVS